MLKPALKPLNDHVAIAPDSLVHAIKAVPPGTIGPDGYQIWWMPTCQTMCGEDSIYPSFRWHVVATWRREQPVTCPRCLAEREQQQFGW